MLYYAASYAEIVMWVKDCNILYAALSLAAATSSALMLWSSYDLQCQRYQCKGLPWNRGENRRQVLNSFAEEPLLQREHTQLCTAVWTN